MVKIIRLTLLAGKQLVRHRTRTLLTLLGVSCGMFLFTTVRAMQSTLDSATRIGAADTTLVVYRENRFCPETSRLPEYYADEMRGLPGVREVIPVKITVNNCGASLDVVVFRGVPPQTLLRYAPDIVLLDGSYETWQQTDDGALIGRLFAEKRGLRVGDAFEGAGVRVIVCGIIESPHAQDNQVAYVHLPFLQLASKRGLGIVTQFNVRVDAIEQLESVASAIDERFRHEADPTYTQPEKAFFAQAAGEMIDLVSFTRWIGYASVLAVLGLIGNAIMLIVRGRVRENAILQTLGYPPVAILYLVLSEGAWLGAAGGGIGVGLVALFLNWRKPTFGNEGQIVALLPDAPTLVIGLALALALGLLASLWPALVASQKPIVESLRS
ncbi:MAG: FtsX-like permease family protein [Spartobacteria bacterium]|nr:FtsX-like permease family protein [Spartobacteria bacterium]